MNKKMALVLQAMYLDAHPALSWECTFPPVLRICRVEKSPSRNSSWLLSQRLWGEKTWSFYISQIVVVVVFVAVYPCFSANISVKWHFWSWGPWSQLLYFLALPTLQFNLASWQPYFATRFSDSWWIGHCSRICILKGAQGQATWLKRQ